jgi:hypothetical protein
MDLERQRQRFTALAEGDTRRAAGADGIEKRFNLQAQRLARCNLRLHERQAGAGVIPSRQLRQRGRIGLAGRKQGGDLRRKRAGRSRIQADHQQLAASVVD